MCPSYLSYMYRKEPAHWIVYKLSQQNFIQEKKQEYAAWVSQYDPNVHWPDTLTN